MSTDVVVHAPSPFMRSFAEVKEMAEIMATAKLVPAHFQKSPGDCILVIRLADHWGMDPFMLAQECFNRDGKLMPSGKLAAGVINAKGKLAARLNYDYTGEGDTREVRVFARFASEDKPREVSVKFKDAKTANEQ